MLSNQVKLLIDFEFYLNLYQGHGVWLYSHESVGYNIGVWPTVFTGMTVARWRQVTSGAGTCQDLVTRHSDLFSSFYNPPWKQARENNQTRNNATLTSKQNIHIIEGVWAAEKFVSNR